MNPRDLFPGVDLDVGEDDEFEECRMGASERPNVNRIWCPRCHVKAMPLGGGPCEACGWDGDDGAQKDTLAQEEK